MHRLKITGRIFDSFYIPKREVIKGGGDRKQCGKRPVRHKIPTGVLLLLV